LEVEAMPATAAQNMAAIARQDSENEKNAIEEGLAGLTARQRETAQYIADMILELRNLAKAAKLFNITVPLEYAYYEAFSVANRVDVPPEEVARLRRLSQAVGDFESPDTSRG
jgi:hypothetical protein